MIQDFKTKVGNKRPSTVKLILRYKQRVASHVPDAEIDALVVAGGHQLVPLDTLKSILPTKCYDNCAKKLDRFVQNNVVENETV